jgi:hypothetical protein
MEIDRSSGDKSTDLPGINRRSQWVEIDRSSGDKSTDLPGINRPIFRG